MKQIVVETGSQTYPIYFQEGFDGFGAAIQEAGLAGRKMMIISDSNVSPLYSAALKQAAAPVMKKIHLATFLAGERSKQLHTIETFYDALLDAHADRKTVVVGLGGGVTGDMAGFAAATFMRGVPFVQVPTTLLAQVDSSVGGKVGIDYRENKNIVGAFYQPEFVYMNMACLNTLPQREYYAGMAEAIKCALIAPDPRFYPFLQENKGAFLHMEREKTVELIQKCCQFKADVVRQDEKESGLREILNFGHTIGHAVETLKEFSLLHGECVALGMAAALSLSVQRGDITLGLLEEVKGLLQSFSLPVSVSGLTADAVYQQLFLDKKVKDNQIGFVLLKNIGEPYRTRQVERKEILDAITYIL